jgi:2-oxo-4-hydroxy-4-carboxy-5-ureidoimidazoline decarboxylase
MTDVRVDIEGFNELSPADATAALEPACGSTPWLRVLVAGRPYGTPAELVAASDGVLLALGWSDVERETSAHALAADVPHGVAVDDLAAYEERFGFPFVMETTGRTAEQINDELRNRSAQSLEDEQPVVRRELAAIVRRCLLVTFV